MKNQENQLLKYNNIYDKLRKKRDLLECLLVQRKYLSHIKEIKDKCQSGNLALEMVIEQLSKDMFHMLDEEKANKLIAQFKG